MGPDILGKEVVMQKFVEDILNENDR